MAPGNFLSKIVVELPRSRFYTPQRAVKVSAMLGRALVGVLKACSKLLMNVGKWWAVKNFKFVHSYILVAGKYESLLNGKCVLFRC